jgi:hypothetical protein
MIVANRKGRARPAPRARGRQRHPVAIRARIAYAVRLAALAALVVVCALLLALAVQLPPWLVISFDFVLFVGVMTAVLLIMFGGRP